MFEENELLTCILGIATTLSFVTMRKRLNFSGSRSFGYAVLFLALSYTLTNLENLWLQDWFNLGEHIFLAAAALFCIRFILTLSGKQTPK